MQKEIEVFEHPQINELHKLHGEEAQRIPSEINDLIAKQFEWVNEYGYKQRPSIPNFPNMARTVFVKTVGNYEFYFDVRYLVLQMSFIYGGVETSLRFNGDGEYDMCIDFDHKVAILYPDDMELLENVLIASFKTEIYNLFLKD